MKDIFVLEDGCSRAITWENQKGEKGKGGMAESHLGKGRKVFEKIIKKCLTKRSRCAIIITETKERGT